MWGNCPKTGHSTKPFLIYRGGKGVLVFPDFFLRCKTSSEKAYFTIITTTSITTITSNSRYHKSHGDWRWMTNSRWPPGQPERYFALMILANRIRLVSSVLAPRLHIDDVRNLDRWINAPRWVVNTNQFFELPQKGRDTVRECDSKLMRKYMFFVGDVSAFRVRQALTFRWSSFCDRSKPHNCVQMQVVSIMSVLLV